MQRDVPTQAALRRVAVVHGSGMDRLHTALTVTGVAILLAAIAFILGATVLT